MQMVGHCEQARVARSERIDEIARIAGVSKGTVYRVLRESDLVNDRTASRVRHVIKRMGYTPVASPSSSRRHDEASRRSAVRGRRIGIITLGRMRQHWPSDLVIGSFVSGMTAVAREFDVDVMLDDLQEPSRLVEDKRIYGAILLADGVGPLSAEVVRSMEMLGRKLPVVWALGMHAGPVGIDRVMPDHAGIGHTAAHHLARGGCKHAAVMTANPRWPAARQRAIAFACAADDAGIEVTCYVVTPDARDGRAYPGRTVAASSFHEAVSAVTHEARPIDGLFIPQESDAVHLLPLVTQMGPRPGQDIPTVYCSSSPCADAQGKAALTAIHINMQDMARRAIQRLESRMKNKAEPPVVVYVRHQLGSQPPAVAT